MTWKIVLTSSGSDNVETHCSMVNRNGGAIPFPSTNNQGVFSVSNNGQFEILQAIKRKDFLYVWERLKYIGYTDVADMEDRYILFRQAIEMFDPDRNNNFIGFYKRYIKNRREKNTTFYITENRNIIKDMKNYNISPDTGVHNMRSHVLRELLKWNNGSEQEIQA